jgi:hypothetical protein
MEAEPKAEAEAETEGLPEGVASSEELLEPEAQLLGLAESDGLLLREGLPLGLLEAVAAARSVLPVLALTELLLLLLGAGRMLWERELLAELLGLAE